MIPTPCHGRPSHQSRDESRRQYVTLQENSWHYSPLLRRALSGVDDSVTKGKLKSEIPCFKHCPTGPLRKYGRLGRKGKYQRWELTWQVCRPLPTARTVKVETTREIPEDAGFMEAQKWEKGGRASMDTQVKNGVLGILTYKVVREKYCKANCEIFTWNLPSLLKEWRAASHHSAPG